MTSIGNGSSSPRRRRNNPSILAQRLENIVRFRNTAKTKLHLTVSLRSGPNSFSSISAPLSVRPLPQCFCMALPPLHASFDLLCFAPLHAFSKEPGASRTRVLPSASRLAKQ